MDGVGADFEAAHHEVEHGFPRGEVDVVHQCADVLEERFAGREFGADEPIGIVATGRCRWKIENENNNTLKTKGYHLEHNFGHGKKHLSSLLAAMNMLALLTHTFLAYCDDAYRLIRATLPTRKTFFDDVRALLRYMCFPSWEAMLDFMMRGLEIGPYAVPEA